MREVARSVGSVALLLYMTAALPQSAVSALPNGELLEFLGGADAIAPELAQYLETLLSAKLFSNLYPPGNLYVYHRFANNGAQLILK